MKKGERLKYLKICSALIRECDTQGRACFPSVRALAEKINIKPKRLSCWIKKERDQWLKNEKDYSEIALIPLFKFLGKRFRPGKKLTQYPRERKLAILDACSKIVQDESSSVDSMTELANKVEVKLVNLNRWVANEISDWQKNQAQYECEHRNLMPLLKWNMRRKYPKKRVSNRVEQGNNSPKNEDDDSMFFWKSDPERGKNPIRYMEQGYKHFIKMYGETEVSSSLFSREWIIHNSLREVTAAKLRLFSKEELCSMLKNCLSGLENIAGKITYKNLIVTNKLDVSIQSLMYRVQALVKNINEVEIYCKNYSNHLQDVISSQKNIEPNRADLHFRKATIKALKALEEKKNQFLWTQSIQKQIGIIKELIDRLKERNLKHSDVSGKKLSPQDREIKKRVRHSNTVKANVIQECLEIVEKQGGTIGTVDELAKKLEKNSVPINTLHGFMKNLVTIKKYKPLRAVNIDLLMEWFESVKNKAAQKQRSQLTALKNASNVENAKIHTNTTQKLVFFREEERLNFTGIFTNNASLPLLPKNK